MNGAPDSNSSSSEPRSRLENTISSGLRSFRLWCVLGIVGSVATSVTLAVGYMKWSLSHYEATANRYETGLDRLISEMNRSMDANTKALEASIGANTEQIALLRGEVGEGGLAEGDSANAFTIEDLKGAFREAVSEGLISIEQPAN